MEKPTIKVLLLPTLLNVIEKSVGTKMFQTITANVDGKKKDITEEGNLSCAFYVSGILTLFGLLDRVRATVAGTIESLELSGWKKTKDLAPGVVVVWDQPIDGSHDHAHIGFYVGKDTAISNSSKNKTPAKHHITFGNLSNKTHRPIRSIYKHSKLSYDK